MYCSTWLGVKRSDSSIMPPTVHRRYVCGHVMRCARAMHMHAWTGNKEQQCGNLYRLGVGTVGEWSKGRHVDVGDFLLGGRHCANLLPGRCLAFGPCSPIPFFPIFLRHALRCSMSPRTLLGQHGRFWSITGSKNAVDAPTEASPLRITVLPYHLLSVMVPMVMVLR